MSEAALQAARPYTGKFPRRLADLADDLDTFVGVVGRWNRVQNLVSRETDELWTRHVADSLQLVKFVGITDKEFIDVGSGGGFPAIPLAIALKGAGTRHTLVESNAKKAAFLRAASREVGVQVEVKAERIEQLDTSARFDVITARAVTGLPQLLTLTSRLFSSSTRALFHKGREYDQELAAASRVWRFDVKIHASDTDTDGVILEVSNLSPAQ